MKKVGDRVMSLDITASRGIHSDANTLTDLRRAATDDCGAVNMDITLSLRVDHFESANLCPVVARDVHNTRVADLPTHLGVEWRLVEDDLI